MTDPWSLFSGLPDGMVDQAQVEHLAAVAGIRIPAEDLAAVTESVQDAHSAAMHLPASARDDTIDIVPFDPRWEK